MKWMRRPWCWLTRHVWRSQAIGIVQRRGFRARPVFGCVRCGLTKVAR